MEFLVLTSLLPWVYAAHSDHKQRLAPNTSWFALLILGVMFLTTGLTDVVIVVFSAVILFAVAWLLYISELIGGADSKALFVLPLYGSLAFPILIVSAVFAIPWLQYRDSEYPVPLLVPLCCSVITVVSATIVF